MSPRMFSFASIVALASACVESPSAFDKDAFASGFDVDAETPDEPLGLRTPGYDGCQDLDDDDECLAAGCHWLDAHALFVDPEADSCEFGATIELCYADDVAQPCIPSDTVCDDGSQVWALWGPDGGVLIARSTTSCGVAQGFVPCDDDAMSPEGDLACACACELDE